MRASFPACGDRYLDLSGNALSGTIPSWIGRMTAMSGLSIGRNSLTGTIPNIFGSMLLNQCESIPCLLFSQFLVPSLPVPHRAATHISLGVLPFRGFSFLSGILD